MPQGESGPVFRGLAKVYTASMRVTAEIVATNPAVSSTIRLTADAGMPHSHSNSASSSITAVAGLAVTVTVGRWSGQSAKIYDKGAMILLLFAAEL